MQFYTVLGFPQAPSHNCEASQYSGLRPQCFDLDLFFQKDNKLSFIKKGAVDIKIVKGGNSG